MTVITASELARNLRRVLDQLEHGDVEIVVTRKTHEIARLLPNLPRLTALEAMADIRGSSNARRSDAWARDAAKLDSRASHEMKDPWAS